MPWTPHKQAQPRTPYFPTEVRTALYLTLLLVGLSQLAVSVWWFCAAW